MPKKPFNRDTFDQMDSGSLRGVSVGGHLLMDTLVIDNPDETDWDDLLLTCDWVLVEQSLTSIPADTTSGVDRSLAAVLERDGALFDTLISPEGIYTKDTTALRSHVGNLLREHNETVATLRREEGQQTMTMQTIPPDVLAKAVSEELARDKAQHQLAELEAQVQKLTQEAEAETKRHMETRQQLQSIQYQPNGQVLQMGNWTPRDHAIDLGKILRLTCKDDIGLPALERSGSSLEEAFLEMQDDLEPAGRSTVARLPFAAIEERQRQVALQRNTLAGGAGARPVDINVNGDGGLLLSAFSSDHGRDGRTLRSQWRAKAALLVGAR